MVEGKYHVLVASIRDPASAVMADYLQRNRGFKAVGERSAMKEESLDSVNHKTIKLHISSESLLYLEELDGVYPEAKSFVFLSKHKSESAIPTLTCHCTGNFGENSYGGNPREIAISWPYLQKLYLVTLDQLKSTILPYEITIEATHHGPTGLKKPVLFVELGSSKVQWHDAKAATLICDSVLSVLESSSHGQCSKVCIGLGGTHYPTKFNRFLIESEFGLAAVASKHNLQSVDETMLNQMIVKSVEKVTHVLIDRKGLGSEKERIIELVERTELEVIKI